MSELLFMKPYCKEVLWGGTKLREEYGYQTEGDHTGEAWVVSANPHGQSVVERGPYAGRTLGWLWQEHRELFGGLEGERFPLLVKLIDAHDNLSIQVHPDDAYAGAQADGSCGKTECWYVVDCEPGTDIIIGHTAKTGAELRSMVEKGEWNRLLRARPIHKGDFFFIPAGTVHAIRRGTLILEIQQNSDTTYRLYDYGRLQDGKPRQLHLRQSLDVIRCPYEESDPRGPIREQPGLVSRELVRCPFFCVTHYRLDGACTLTEKLPFRVADILEGEGRVNGQPIAKGDHFIASAQAEELAFEGRLEFVVSHV